jgi:hypothetical protein
VHAPIEALGCGAEDERCEDPPGDAVDGKREGQRQVGERLDESRANNGAAAQETRAGCHFRTLAVAIRMRRRARQ